MKPRPAISAALTFLLGTWAAAGAEAGLVHPASWRKSSDDGQIVLVMVSPLPVEEDAGHQAYDGREIRDIRARYSVSGVYRGDSAVPLWTIPYWSPGADAFISPDGNHVVMTDTDWRQSSGHIATFYRSGSELASYHSRELIPLLAVRARCGVYHPACTANVIDWKAMTLTVGTNQGDEFVFDLTNGKIVRQWSSFPLYVVAATSLMAGVLLAIVAWIIVRSRRSRLSASVGLAVLVLALASCSTPTAPPAKTAANPSTVKSNRELLDEVNAAGRWFHAKKTRPIWVQEIKEARKVKTLEGEETVEPGSFLCKGEAGDIWPQKKADLEKKYVATEEEKDGWRKYQPRPDAEGVMAAEVGHPFVVYAKWGELKGKAGDFLIKNYADKGTDYPADVWLVDQKLFGQTYERVAGSK